MCVCGVMCVVWCVCVCVCGVMCVVWCGVCVCVVWCGVVWCGVVWCVWCDVCGVVCVCGVMCVCQNTNRQYWTKSSKVGKKLQ